MIEFRGRLYRVTREDGTQVHLGSTVTSLRGDEATFLGLERGPEHNGTSKVLVEWTTDGYTNSYYHTVFGLTVTPV